MNYGTRAKEWITDHDVTQKKLAEHFQVTEAMLSNYLTGRNEMPVDILVKIAQYFQISMDYLVGLCDQPKRPLLLKEEEGRMIEEFRTLSKEQKELLLQILRFMTEQNRR